MTSIRAFKFLTEIIRYLPEQLVQPPEQRPEHPPPQPEQPEHVPEQLPEQPPAQDEVQEPVHPPEHAPLQLVQEAEQPLLQFHEQLPPQRTSDGVFPAK